MERTTPSGKARSRRFQNTGDSGEGGRGRFNGIDLFVGNLPPNITQDGIENLFSEHSNVQKVYFRKPAEMGASPCYAFVKVPTMADAIECIKKLNDFSINGNRLHVQIGDKHKSAVINKMNYEDHQDFLHDEELPPWTSESDSNPTESSSNGAKHELSARQTIGRGSRVRSPLPSVGRGSALSSVAVTTPASSTGRGSASVPGFRIDGAAHFSGTNTSVERSTADTVKTDLSPEAAGKTSERKGKASEEKPTTAPSPCLYCSKSGRLRCGFCKGPYCSKQCQTADWQKHRTICSQKSSSTKSSPSSSSKTVIKCNFDADDFDEGSGDEDDMQKEAERIMHLSPEEQQLALGHLGTSVNNYTADEVTPLTSPGNNTLPVLEPEKLVTTAKAEAKVLKSGLTLQVVVEACGGLAVWTKSADASAAVGLERLQSFLKGHRTPDQMSCVDFNTSSVGDTCLLYRPGKGYCRAKLMSCPFDSGSSVRKVCIDLIDDGASEVVSADALFELSADLQPPALPAKYLKLVLSCLKLSAYGQANALAFVNLLNSILVGQRCDAEIVSLGRDGTVYADLFIDGKNIGNFLQHTPFVHTRYILKSDGLRHGIARPGYPVSANSTPSPSCFTANSSSQFSFMPLPFNGVQPPLSSLPVRFQGPVADMSECVMCDASGLQQMQLTAGLVDVKLVSVSPFAHIFIQLADSYWQHELQRLHDGMNSVLSSTKNSSYTPREGDICCARFHADQRFYRVRVERVLLDGRADVYFVDFGNTATVPIAELRHMKVDFGKLPFQAIRVVLAGVKPADVSGSWSYEARRMLQRPKHLLASLVTQPANIFGPTVAELFDRSGEMTVLLNRELVSAGFAVPASPGWPHVSANMEKPPAGSLAGFQPAQSSMGQEASDQLRMKLEVGKTYSVRVVHTRTVSLFHVSIADDTLQEQLASLNARIDQYCSDLASCDISFQPSVGELCCARSARSGRFHRAIVVAEQPATGQVFLHFVDLGCREYHRYEDLRRIQPDMLQLPFIAIACAIQNLKKKESTDWPKASTALFEELTHNKVLRCVCRFVSPNPPLLHRVELFDDAQPQKPIDICRMIVAAGFGQLGRCVQQSADQVELNRLQAAPAGGKQPTHVAMPCKQPDSDCESKPAVSTRLSRDPSLGNKPHQAVRECSHYGHKAMSCLSRETLAEGQTLRVILTHATSPSSFFVQRKDQQNRLLELCTHIQSHCSKVNVAEGRPAVGDLCCALFKEDGNHYRAVVDQVLSGDQLQVAFIDFGNSATVPMAAVLPPYLVGLNPQQAGQNAQLAIQAIECRLALDLPTGMPLWPQAAVKLLQQCVNQEYDISVVSTSSADQKAVVDVFDLQTGESLCNSIRDQFLSKAQPSLAAASQVPPTQSSKEASCEGAASAIRSATMSNEQECMDNKGLLTSSVDEVVPTGRLSPFGASVPPSMVSSPTLNMLKISDMQQEKLPVGDTGVIISDLSDPGNFCVQVTGESSRKLLAMMQDMNEKYSNMTSDVAVPLLPDVVCAAFFVEDQGWYRASIDLIMGREQVYVTYLDFGNTSLLTPSELQPLLPEFCVLPLQAIRCRLAGIAPFPKGTSWSQAAIDLFKKHMGGSTFVHCELRRVGECVDGEVPVKVVSSLSPPRSVNDVLVAERHAHKLLGAKPTALSVPSPRSTKPDASLAPAPKFMLSDLTSATLPCDEDYFSVVISEVESPSSLYLQLAKKEVAEAVDELSAELARHCQHAAPIPVTDLVVDQLCAALWHVDQRWYRAVVVKVSADHVIVRFVDFGNKEKVEAAGIRHIDRSSLAVPCQSLHCRISGIKSCQADGNWPTEARQVFDHFSSSLMCAKICNRGGDGVYGVQLFDTSTDVDVDLQQELINGGWAMSLQQDMSFSPPESKPLQQVQPVAAAVSEVSSPLVKFADVSVIQPPPDDFFEIVISEVESPTSLFAQLAKVEVAKSLQELGAQLLSSCRRAQPVNVEHITTGDMVAALFSADQRWYRAVVCSINSGKIEVRFVDYGNKDLVDVESVCRLDGEFLSLPCQAFHCSLAKISKSASNGLWSPRARRLLESFVSKPLCARVVGIKDGQHLVDLIDTSSSEDVDLAEQLIQAGLALPPGREKLTIEDMTFVEPPPEEEFFEATLSEVSSPEKLFVQMATREVAANLNILLQQLNAFCRKETSRLNVTELAVGDVCAARFSADGQWYRAAVIKLAGDQATVRFLDFGNEEVLHGNSLCRLDNRFHTLPCQAICCCLSGAKSAQEDGSWPDGALQSIQRHSGVRLCVRSCRKADGVHVVDIFNTSSGDDVNLAEELIAAGFAVEEGAAANSGSATGPVVPLARIPTEDEFHAVVVDVRSAGDMHIQVAEAESIRALTDMITAMAKAFASVSPNMDYLPEKGEICCARFSADQTWYRAVVDDFTADRAHYQVTFIDFGNPDVVPSEDLHPLPAEFCAMPRLAVPCCLATVKPRPGVRTWCDESTEFIRERTPMSRSFLTRVIQRSDTMLAIDLINSSSGTEVSLRKQLIDADLALDEATPL